MAGTADIGIRIFLDDVASAGLGQINGLLSQMYRNLLSNGLGIQDLGAKIATLGVLGGFATTFGLFTGAIKQSVDAASEFQQAIYNLAVSTHTSMDVATQYADKLMNLAATSTYTTTDIANGVAVLGRSGYTLQDIMNGMAQAGIDLGIATRSTAVQGFSLLAQAMSAMQAPASQALQYADLLQFAYEHQTGSVSQLQSALSQVTPAAERLKVPFDQVVASLDVLGPAMGNTSTAGTALRYAMAAITAPTATALSALASVGLVTVSATNPAVKALGQSLISTGAQSAQFVEQNDTTVKGLQAMFTAAQNAGLISLDTKFEEWATSTKAVQNAFYNANGTTKDWTTDLQTLSQATKGMNSAELSAFLKDVFSVRGGQGIQDLLENLQKYNGYMKTLNQTQDNAGGVTQRWQEQMKTLSGATAGLKSSLTDLGVVIGTPFLSELASGATKLNEFISRIRTLALAHQQALPTFLMMGTALSGIGLVIAIVVMGIMGLLSPLLLIPVVILGVVAASVLLAAGLTALVMWIRNAATTSTPLGNVLRAIGSEFKSLGSFIGSTFSSTFQQLGSWFHNLGVNGQSLGTVLRVLGAIFGGVIVVAIGLVVGALRALVQGIASLILGIGMILGGLVLTWSGVFNMIIGIVKAFIGLFVGLFTGNWSMALAGVKQFGTGFMQLIKGVFSVVLGLIVATFGTIVSAVSTFVMGVINFFTHLATVLVGHSIIPDMMNAIRNVFINIFNAIVAFIVGIINQIINWFTTLGSRVVSAVTAAFNLFRTIVSTVATAVLVLIINLVASGISHIESFGSNIVSGANNAWSSFRNAISNGINNGLNLIRGLPQQAINALGNLGSMLFNSGVTAMQQFANGLGSAISAVTQKVQDAAGQVANFLAHHSPAKMGPLADDDKWMPNMMRMFASGIAENAPLLTGAVNQAAGGIAGAPALNRMSASSGGIAGGNANGVQTINLVLDGNTISQVVLNQLTGQMQMNGLGRAFR
jgi:phage-related protein